MELQTTVYLNVELQPKFFNEFIACGVPIPHYVNGASFVLTFNNAECYLNYLNTLRIILKDLQQADPKRVNYEIQKSRYFIKSILFIIKNQYAKKFDNSLMNNCN